MIRIGVVGDVHACDSELDHLLCVGDIVNGPGDPDRCVELVQFSDVLTVRGNHDRWLLEGTQMFPDAHRIEDLAPATVAFCAASRRALSSSLHPEGACSCVNGVAENDMNGITADDYGYALEANDDLQNCCAAVVDARAATITPLAFAADGTVVALASQPY